jgi:hypothetical protein
VCQQSSCDTDVNILKPTLGAFKLNQAKNEDRPVSGFRLL